MRNDQTHSLNIKILSWLNFLLDLRLYGPVAVICFQRICGSYVMAMAVFGMAMFASVVFELPTGILSDRVGRRPTLIIGQAASFFSVLIYAIAGSGGGPTLLYLGAVLEGLSRALFSGNNNALLHDSLKASGQEKEFHWMLGKLSAFFQLAAAASAVVGGVVAHWSFSIVLWLSVIPQAAAFVLSFLIIEPHLTAAKEVGMGIRGSVRHFIDAVQTFFTNRRLVVLGSVSAVSDALGESAYQFSSAFFASLWPIWALGFSKLLSSLGAALSFRLSGFMIDRFGTFTVLMVSRIYGRVVGTIASLLPGLHSPILISTSSLFFGTGIVANETLMQREFNDKQRATMGSIGSMLVNLLFTVAAPLLGLLADRIGPAKAFLTVQLVMIPAVIALWLEYRKDAGKHQHR